MRHHKNLFSHGRNKEGHGKKHRGPGSHFGHHASHSKTDAISGKHGQPGGAGIKAYVDPQRCMGCGKCVASCKAGALSMVEEPEVEVQVAS